jgi:hypothetical protein
LSVSGFSSVSWAGVNNELAYPNYFAMIPTGSDPNATLTEGFFEVASRQSPQSSALTLAGMTRCMQDALHTSLFRIGPRHSARQSFGKTTSYALSGHRVPSDRLRRINQDVAFATVFAAMTFTAQAQVKARCRTRAGAKAADEDQVPRPDVN